MDKYTIDDVFVVSTNTSDVLAFTVVILVNVFFFLFIFIFVFCNTMSKHILAVLTRMQNDTSQFVVNIIPLQNIQSNTSGEDATTMLRHFKASSSTLL